MIFSKKAQSIIEYTVVVILVIVGIVLMRPYVIRSVNAHMKGWQDGVSDSMKDHLPNAMPPVPARYCGDGTCDTDLGENCASCSADCGACAPVCGDSVCNGTENCNICPSDCGSCCPNGVCDFGETNATCPADCPLQTPCNPPNGTCDSTTVPPENIINCCVDCAVSGDFNCSPCENASANWCDCHCGSNGCETTLPPGQPACSGDPRWPENSSNCSADCAPVNPCAGINCNAWDYDSGGCRNHCNCCHACYDAGGRYAGCASPGNYANCRALATCR